MGFEVKFDALDTLYGGVYSRGGAWSSALSEVSNRVGTLISSDNMSGEGADSAKLYLDSVHNTILPMLADLIRLHVNNCLLYVTDYQSNIDTSLHAVIDESELTGIKASLKQDAENASDIDDEVQKALKSVSDLVSVSCAGMSTVSSKNTSIRNKITALIDDVTALEDSHSQKDFTETGELISTLTAFIKERLGDTRAFKTNFSVDTIANSASFQAMYQAYLALNEKNAENQDAVSVAAEKENERIEALQEEYQQMLEEYEKRQKEAETEKWIVTGLCVVGSIIAIAATGGTATPLVVGAVSAISGAVMAGNSAAADQYVEYGWNVSEWDLIGIGTSALLGGVSGFITGYVGAGLSNAVTSSLSGSAGTLLNSSHAAVRIGTNAVIGSASEVLSGIGARGTTTFVSALIATGGDISASLNTAVDAASNLKSIMFDAALGATVASVRGIQEPMGSEVHGMTESGVQENNIISSADAEEYAWNAIKGPDNADAVVLGKYAEGSPSSYDQVAQDIGAQYYNLDNWDELAEIYTDDEMWKINEKFLDIETSSGRDIYLTHNPADYLGDGSFYSRELEYLKNNCYTFEQVGDLWKAVR